MTHPYIYPSRTLVYNLINRDNGTFFNPNDVVLTNLRPDSKTNDVRNTALDVVGVDEEGVSGKVTVRYRRLDIAQVFARCNVEIAWDGESDTWAVMQAVNALYGTVFEEEDIEVRYFNPNTLPLTVTVQMRDSSLAWVGALSVEVKAFSQSLTTALQTVLDPVFDYPTAQSAKAQGPLYLRPYDFDTYWPMLKGVKAGVTDPTTTQALVSVINGVLPAANQWGVSTTPTVRNLAEPGGNLQILYAGRPLAEFTHRLNVDRIVVVVLDAVLCTDVFGYLVLHFSDPSLDLDASLVNKDIGKVGLS